MPSLKGYFTDRRDAGAAATIVTILLAGGVLIGMTALAVDVGRLYVEREELQSGADAAAMAVALDCAKGRAECSGGLDAGTYADKNAKDGLTNVWEVCGVDKRGRLPACTSGSLGNLTDCLGTPKAGVSYVQVRTRSEVAEGDYLFPYTFAQALAGGTKGTTVGACARVAYGPPKSGLALTISACEFDRAMDSAGEVAAPPWPPDPDASKEVALGVHGSTSTTCEIPTPAGFDQPGGFGWLDEAGGPCAFLLSGGLTYGGDTGASPSKDCREVLERLRDTHEVVPMPIYDGQRGVGANAEYHLFRLAAFVVTGYFLPGMDEASNVHSSFDPCSGSDTCVYGYFVDVEFLPGDIGEDTGADLGLMAVKTIG